MRTDAEAAGILQDTAPGADEGTQQTFVRKHPHHLLGTARDADLHVGVNLLALEEQRHRLDVAVRGVRAGANHDLIDALAHVLGDGLNVAGVVRRGGEGF